MVAGVVTSGVAIPVSEVPTDPAEQLGYMVGTLGCPMLLGIVSVASIIWAMWYYRR